jgi:hypothetical protein
MIRLFSLILCLFPFSLFAQHQVVLNSGDTTLVSKATLDGDYYTLEKEDGRTSKLPKNLVKAVIRDYPTLGDESAFTYCQIVGHQKLFSTQVTVTVDYGQATKYFTRYSESRIKDEEGNIQSFNSMIDALNYMGSQGWEFEQAYTITIGQQNVYHFLLKREK